MTYLKCSECGHPHSHAFTVPPSGGKPVCEQCPHCIAARRDRDEGKVK